MTVPASPLNTEGLEAFGLSVLSLIILAVIVILAVALVKKKLSILLFGVAGLLIIGLMVSLRDPAKLERAGNALSALLFNF